MCIIKLKIPLALEENVSFVPVQQKYLLFIVDKFATFCVTFLTEVKRNKKKNGVWSVDFLLQIMFFFSIIYN